MFSTDLLGGTLCFWLNEHSVRMMSCQCKTAIVAAATGRPISPGRGAEQPLRQVVGKPALTDASWTADQKRLTETPVRMSPQQALPGWCQPWR